MSPGVVSEFGGVVAKLHPEQSVTQVSDRAPPPTGQYTCSTGHAAAPPAETKVVRIGLQMR